MKSIKTGAIAAVLCMGMTAANALYSVDLTPAQLALLTGTGPASTALTGVGITVPVGFSDIAVTYLGTDAAFSNTLFHLASFTFLFNNQVPGLVDTTVNISGVATGPLSFQLSVDKNNNGALDVDDYVLNSATSFTRTIALSPYEYIVGFEDTRNTAGLEAGGDLDYNDFVFKVSIPEPSTGALLLAGLAAMGFVARRRRVV